MSYPANRREWAWEWMGFNPPNTCYNSNPIPDKYNKFKQCFNAYYGIGDFDYWKRDELIKLTQVEKIELVGYLLDDFKAANPHSLRRYIGLSPDGSLNKTIDKYADGRKNFFDILSVEECRKQKYPHNQRCRKVEGYHCDDCNTFYENECEDFERTEGLSNCWNVLHNINAICLRSKTETPIDVLELRKEYDTLYKRAAFEIPLDEVHSMLSRVADIKKKYSRLLSKV